MTTAGPHFGRLEPGARVKIVAVGPAFSDLAPAVQSFPARCLALEGGTRGLFLKNTSPRPIAFMVVYMKASALSDLAALALATSQIRKERARR